MMDMNKEERYLVILFDHAIQEADCLLQLLQEIERMSGWEMIPPGNYLNLVKRDLYEWLKVARQACEDTSHEGSV